MVVGVEGTGETAKFTFTGVPKPSAILEVAATTPQDVIPADFNND
ncbi:MAG TPA: hypothetical protein VNW94_28980 [Streptosporangiaceae bacterium]|nr:hypothetical protein [Streptosporangiaceae bacterium]